MNGYRKRNGARISISAPVNPARPLTRLTLPEDHPCRGCPIIDLTGSKPYCFLPGCLRYELTQKPGHKLRKLKQMGGI